MTTTLKDEGAKVLGARCWLGDPTATREAHLTFKLDYNRSKTLCGTESVRKNVLLPEGWIFDSGYWGLDRCVICDNIYRNTNKLRNLSPRLQMLLLESTEL